EITWKKTPSQISGGEAQRAGIVRAVINNPNVLFADEPTGALNSANGTAVLDVFQSLHEKGQSIVMVTHDKRSALRGNRILYIRDGQIYGECNLGNYVPGDTGRTERFEAFISEMGW
ncbi:MAG: ATP-binding cassette domain-containing protein, partial [Roseburia sp.]|nr:ATP-binding cassette domain-containing protein [Roseburia sp.]